MTAKELYSWAVEHNCEDLPLITFNLTSLDDGLGYGYVDKEELYIVQETTNEECKGLYVIPNDEILFYY